MIGSAVGILGALSACATFVPDSLTEEEALQIKNESLGRYFSYQEQVAPHMTLYDAMARALKYNLDARVAQLQSALEMANLDIESYEALPKIYLTSGYTYRSNPPKRKYYDASGTLQGGRIDTDTSAANISAEMSWNILDFGLSYIRAQQTANRVLVAQERTRLAIWQVMREIQMAYWSGVAAQNLEKSVSSLDSEIQSVLNDLNSRVAQRNLPIESLQIQKNLLKIKLDTAQMRENLIEQKLRLSDLAGVDPDIAYTFADDTGYIPLLMMDMNALDRLSFENRPELRITTYEQRITEQESKLALQSLLPTVSINAGLNRTSDAFEQNPTWISAGLQISWNLLNIFKAPANIQKASLAGDLTRNRQIAVGMSFIVGNRLAVMNYQQAVRTYANNLKLFEIEKKIEASVRASSYGDISPKTKIDRIQAHLNRVGAEMRLAMSYGQMQAAMFEVLRSAGVEVFPSGDVSSLSVTEVSEQIESSVEEVNGITFMTRDTSRSIFRQMPFYQDLLDIQMTWQRDPQYSVPHFRFIKRTEG